MILHVVAAVAALLVMPFVLTGVILRVKSLWSGRRGPPILQPAFDVWRLLRKSPVYSSTTTPIFRIAPVVGLLTAAATATISPLFGATALVSFPFDFVWLAYAWGLGRVAMMLAALDTGSAFEGMGAAREATFGMLVEPALFLIVGALCLSTGARTLHGALAPPLDGAPALVVWACAIVALLIILQVETARMPVDDPSTHLELTMIHEVMVLDHSGPDLAALQTAAAIKLYVLASCLATLLNPWAGHPGLPAAGANLVLCLGIAAVVGTVESLIARLKLRMVPPYLMAALVAGVIACLATAWRLGEGQ